MYAYIILLVVIVLQSMVFGLYPKARVGKLQLLLLFIEVVFVAGFRVSTGGDTDVYLDYFEGLRGGSLYDAIGSGYETGFAVFCYLLGKVSDDPQILIFASSFVLTALIFAYISKYSASIWLSVFLYITLLNFYTFMNLMRFGLAMAVIVQTLGFIEKKKPVKFLLCIAIAMMFHASAVMFIPAYWVCNSALTRTRVILVLLASLLGLPIIRWLSIIAIIGWPRFVSYQDAVMQFQGNLANVIVFAISFCLLAFAWVFDQRAFAGGIRSGGNTVDRTQAINLWLLVIGTSFSMMAISSMILTRFTIMYTIFSIVYIPNILMSIKNKNIVYLMGTILVIVSFVYNCIVLVYRPEWFLVTPYRNALFP